MKENVGSLASLMLIRSAMSEGNSSISVRYHGLDFMRAAMMMGILLHAGVMYMTMPYGDDVASISADISLLALTVLTAFINSVLFISLHFFFRSIGALFEGILNPRQFNYCLWRQFEPQPMRFAYKAFVL